MQLTKYTDISLRVMMHLAIVDGELSTIKDIAQRYNISRNHLMKVVHKLATLGYIKSTQGRGGGISLALEPEDIVVGRIVRAMEPTLEIIDCEGNGCPLIPACLLKAALNEATSAFLKALDGFTVADLVLNRPQLLRLIG